MPLTRWTNDIMTDRHGQPMDASGGASRSAWWSKGDSSGHLGYFYFSEKISP